MKRLHTKDIYRLVPMQAQAMAATLLAALHELDYEVWLNGTEVVVTPVPSTAEVRAADSQADDSEVG